jgi:endoglucanase Acf2
MDVSLFHPSLLYGGRILEEGRFFKNDRGDRNLPNSDPRPFLRVPFPTGAFWTNLVVIPVNEGGKTSSSSSQIDRDRFTYPIVAYPYSYQWSSLGKLQVSYSASRRVIRATTIQDQFAPDVTIGSVEGIGARHVVKFDSLSVTLRFYSVESIQHSWETYIVQGSPYITVVYSGLIPELRALSDFNDIMCPPTPQGGEISSSPIQQRTNGEGPNQRRRGVGIATASSSSTSTATTGKMLGICDIATDSSRQKKGITGVQFVVTTKEGLTWLVFASEPITFEFDLDAARLIKSRDKYTGVIRLALVPPEMVSDGSSATSLDIGHLQSSSGVKRLIYHAGTYPISGAVSWDFRSGMINPLASPTSPSTSTDKAHRRRAMERNETRQLLTSDSPKDNNIGTVSFSFDTNHMTASSPSTDVPLLMLALPHHAASISSAEALLLRPDDFDLFYHSIKGRMVVVVGNIWSYEEELTSIGFGNDPAPASSLSLAGTSASSQRSSVHESTAILAIDQSIRDLILKNVESDLKINLPDLTGGAYSFGKQIARLAQLAHIAEVVDAANMIEIDAEVNRIKNDTNNDLHRRASSETSSLTSLRAFALLEKYLTMWLAGESDEMLVYDAQLGGILSKVGTTDINADFGNARYNDHHFHCKSCKSIFSI